MAEILQIQFDEEEFDAAELSDIPIWSSGEFTATVTPNPLPLFTYQPGDIVPGSPGPRASTRLDTNMLVAGQMNDDEGMKIHSIAIELFSVGDAPALGADNPGYEADRPFVSAPNMKRCMQDLVGALKVSTNVSQVELPFANYPTGFDVVVANGGARRQDGPAAIRGVDTYVIGMNGIPEIRGHVIYQPIYKIKNAEVFRFDLFAPNQGVVTGLTRALLARVYLLGKHRRPMV